MLVILSLVGMWAAHQIDTVVLEDFKILPAIVSVAGVPQKSVVRGNVYSDLERLPHGFFR